MNMQRDPATMAQAQAQIKTAAMTVRAPQLAAATTKPADDDDAEEMGEQKEVFANYVCKTIKFGKVHPGDIAEASGLALVPLPDPTYPLQDSLPEKVIEEGKLSKMQLEGVLFAAQAHQRFLPNGARQGFFVGDGAGCGKGRIIAGSILNSWARGTCQHVWLSTSNDLRLDAERDLRDLGMHIKVIDGCQELSAESGRAFGLSKDFKEGVLFSTYSTLIGTGKGNRGSRLDQIVNWCGGEDFCGILAFDEAHKAKNFQLGENAELSTKTSKCVIDIQRKLPKARVIYCSATGVTELSNLAYCERMGLWGKGLPFETFEAFHSTVSKRGVFFLEMLAMELKRSGSYVSRGLSFGQAEFETVSHKLTDEQIALYDKAAKFFSKIHTELEIARQKANAPKRLMTQYWGAHQRFFKQLVISFKVDFMSSEVLKCVEDGHAVVIGLQGTGEAALNRAMERAKGAATNTWLSTTLETIIGFLENNFPVKVAADGASSQAMPDDSDDVPPMLTSADAVLQSGTSQPAAGSVIQECVDARDALIEEAKALNLPFSALDMLIENLGGPTKVAEMTGRSGRLIRKNNEIVYQQRGRAEDEVDQVNVKECQRFMRGEKLVAVISDAASTGISLHSNRSCQNQRRRVHLTLELPWSADKAVQQLGRSHRSNQVSAPIYKLVISDLAGEMRFASAVAKRLQSLGALTKGDRRAAVGQDMQEFDLDTLYGRTSLRRMLESIDQCVGTAAGAKQQELFDLLKSDAAYEALLVEHDVVFAMNVRLKDALSDVGFKVPRQEGDLSNVKKFLGRLLGLPVRLQNALFHYFFSVMKHEIETAKKEGRYSDAITDLYGADETQIKLEASEVVHTNSLTGATCTIHSMKVDRGLTFEKALEKLKEHKEASQRGEKDKSGFFETRREVGI